MNADEPRTYSRMYKESKDLRDGNKNRQGSMTSMVDYDPHPVNSYLQLHMMKKIRQQRAAKIIQKWYREYQRRKQNSQNEKSKLANRPEWNNNKKFTPVAGRPFENKTTEKREPAKNKSRNKKGETFGKHKMIFINILRI